MPLASRAEVAIFMPSFAPNDAMATHTLELRDALRQNGVAATIYADEIKPGAGGEAIPFARFRVALPKKSRFILYQAGTGSNLVRHLVARKEPLLIQYHNITPRSHFVRFEPGIASSMAWGRRQLESLIHHTDLALGVSRYNAEDLIRTGFREIAISPPLIRPLPIAPAHRSYGGIGHSLLFVGRVAPNKAHQDLIAAVAAYNFTFSGKVRLYFVGSTVIPAYERYLRSLAGRLGVGNEIIFASAVPSDELAKMYASAHLFVSASQHEGFGFPLIEAMRAGLPVVAVGSSAIPETVASAAVVTASSDPEVLATAWHRVLSDPDLRSQLVERGAARAAAFDLTSTRLANLAALAYRIPIEGIAPSGLYYRRDLPGGTGRYVNAKTPVGTRESLT